MPGFGVGGQDKEIWLVVWNKPRCPSCLPAGAVVLSNRGVGGFAFAMVGSFPHTFADFSPGDRVNVAGRLQCWDNSHDAHLFKALNDGLHFLVEGLISGANDLCTFMNAQLRQQFSSPNSGDG